LNAMAQRGRAEIKLLMGEVIQARRELEHALATHCEIKDGVEVAEDQRVLAGVLSAEGDLDEAEQTLRQVIERAESLGRPQLAADAARDLARLLKGCGRETEARDVARSARSLFSQLGAEAEIKRLDQLLS